MIIVSQVILILSVLGILFIIIRKIPTLLNYQAYSEEDISFYKEVKACWNGLKERAKTNQFFHTTVMPETEKFLRRIKVLVLKLDNFLAQRVERLKKIRKKRERENQNNLPS